MLPTSALVSRIGKAILGRWRQSFFALPSEFSSDRLSSCQSATTLDGPRYRIFGCIIRTHEARRSAPFTESNAARGSLRGSAFVLPENGSLFKASGGNGSPHLSTAPRENGSLGLYSEDEESATADHGRVS